jgi:hypothetical protein
MTKSTVMVWSLIALGVVSGVASAIMLVVAYLIWTAPRKKLLKLDLERDAAGVLAYRSFPFLVLSVLIRVNFDRPRCKESLGKELPARQRMSQPPGLLMVAAWSVVRDKP